MAEVAGARGAGERRTVSRRRRAVLALAALAVAGLALFALGWFPQGPVHRLLEARLRGMVGPGSRVGAVRVVPGRLTAEVTGLVLDAPTYRLEADRARLTLSPRTLSGSGLFVERLEVDGARLTLRTPAEPAPASEPIAGPIVVRALAIRGATVRWLGTAGEVVLRDVDVRGGLGTGTLEVRSSGGTWHRPRPIDIGPAHGRLRVSPALDLHLEALEAGLARSRVRLSGSLGRLDALRPDLSFTVRADLAELEPFTGTAAAGLVEGEGRVSGTAESPDLRAELRGERLRAAGWLVDRLRAQVTHEAKGGRTETTAALSLLGGTGRLEAGLHGKTIRGRLRLSGIEVGRIPPSAGGGAVTGSVSGELKVEGELAALTWDLALQTAPSKGARSLPLGRLVARGRARGTAPVALDGRVAGTVTLPSPRGPLPLQVDGDVRSSGDALSADLAIGGLGGDLSAVVRMRGPVVSVLKLRGRSLELSRLDARAGGRADLDLELSGPRTALSGTGEVRLEAAAWGTLELGAIRAGLSLRRGAAEIALEAPRFHATARARVPAGTAPVLRADVRLDETPLAAFHALLPPEAEHPLEGMVSGTADVAVPLGAPARATATARIERLDVSRGEISARATQPFGLGYENGRVDIRGLRLEGEGLRLEADGAAALDATGPLALHVRGEGDLSALPLGASRRAAGVAQADVRLGGTRQAPRAEGYVDLGGATLEGEGLPPVRITQGRLLLDGQALQVPGFTAAVARGEVRAQGRVPIAAAWPAARSRPGPPAGEEAAALTIEWGGIDAAALTQSAGSGADARLEAALVGRAELEGGLASLEELRAVVTLPPTVGRAQDVPFEVSPAVARLQAGRLTIEEVALQAAGGTLRVGGAVDLVGRQLDLSGRGTLELRALSAFLEDTALTGTAEVDLAVQGGFDAPRPQGTLRVRDGTVRLRALPQALGRVRAEIVMEAGTARVVSASAELGGGELTMTGQARLEGAGVADARFVVAGRGLAVRYPEGMRSRLDADLTLSGGSGAFKLAGTVRAVRGLYDVYVALEETLTAPTPQTVDSPLLRSVGLDILVTTENPVLVRNNLARLQATGRLTVRGDLQSPSPVGTLGILPGGKLFLQGREFVIDSGRLVYAGTWDPEMLVEASVSIADVSGETGLDRGPVKVTVALEGRMEAPRVSLRSDHGYSRSEIVNLITTGDSQSSATGLALGGSAAALLAGRLTGGLGGLGLDEVSIQPELVAREGEVESGARFTFGKRLTRRVNLVYSLSLQDPEARFIQVEVTPGRQVALRVRRNDAGSFTYGGGQRFRFGGPAAPEAATEEKVRIAEVRLEGDSPLEPEGMRALVRTRPGDRRSIWDLQDAAEKAREELVEGGHIEAEVSVRLEGQVAVFSIHAGPRYRWRVEGMDSPPDLTGAIRSALFEEDALERGRARLLEALHRRGHLRAEVVARAVAEEGRTLLFQVRPGPVLKAEVSFPGAQALSPSRLLEVAGGAGRILTSPEAAQAMVAAYQGAHYRTAEVGPPRVEETPGGVRVVVPVREGPRARVVAVRFEGATRTEEELGRVAALTPGAAYDEVEAVAAADRVRGHYFGLGHPAARVNASLGVRGADLEVVFQIVEGERVTVKEVVLTGLRRTREFLVRRQVPLHPGDPLDPRKVAELERRLLDLGLFARAAATVSDDNPATVTVALEEGERAGAGYLLSYNDDKGTRGELDGELRHLLGLGLSLGGRVSAGPELRDLRLFLHLPALFPTGKLTVSGFRLAEDLPLVAGEEGGETFQRVQTGAQLQGTRGLGGRWDLIWGYRIKRSTVTSPFAVSSRKVAGLEVSLLRDTRDNPLDARRGRFWSLSLEVAPRKLGSDFDFVKGFAQAFMSHRLTETLTWAHGYRLGLARPFGGEPLVGDEGFEAGGANSIRGFDPGEVGPAGYRFGREAVIVLNQELRYHHPSGLGAVAFYDAGNTFATVADFSVDLRHVLGVGVRWSSPVGLLRVDLGRPLNRQEGDAGYKFFVSLGQAF